MKILLSLLLLLAPTAAMAQEQKKPQTCAMPPIRSGSAARFQRNGVIFRWPPRGSGLD